MKISFIKNIKIVKTILGLVLIKISFILFLSFASYIANDLKKENSLGIIGYLISNNLLYNGIGISIFFIPVILFLLGLKIFFFYKKINIRNIILHILFFIYWIPMTLSLFFSNKILCGNFIFQIKYLFIYFIGKIGLILILLTSKIIYIILVFKVTSDKLFIKKSKFFFIKKKK